MRAQQDAAGKVATRLAGHPLVHRVHYPGLPECDPDGIVGRQMRGAGAMVAFAVEGGFAAATRVTSEVRLFTHAVSLGGVDSLIQHPAALTHRPVAAEARPGADLLRISVGLEDADDLCRDLDRALAAARD